jgi:D-alanyl-D-alanine carboxypeptidase
MVFLLFALLVTVCCGASSSCLQNIATVANEIVNSFQQRRATWGINITLLQKNGSLQNVFGWNANRFVIPASNNKIPTTSQAFLVFGPLQTFPTKVFLSGNQLCVKAAGVPLVHDDLRQFVANISSSLPSQLNVQVDDSLFGPQVVPGGG